MLRDSYWSMYARVVSFFPILAAHWLAHIVHHILSETRAVIDLGGSKEAPKLVV